MKTKAAQGEQLGGFLALKEKFMDAHMVRRMKKQLRGVAGRVSECVSALQLILNEGEEGEQERLGRFGEAMDGLVGEVQELADEVTRDGGGILRVPT